jgi:hypothetical protein
MAYLTSVKAAYGAHEKITVYGNADRNRSHMRSRIGLFVAAALASVAIPLLTLGTNPSTSSAPREIALIYVGADDCAPCRRWQNDAGAAFRSTEEFRRLTYREVKSPTLFALLKDEHWPEDLRTFRENLGPGTGVPLWLVLANGVVVGQHAGASRWQTNVWPQLQSLLR